MTFEEAARILGPEAAARRYAAGAAKRLSPGAIDQIVALLNEAPVADDRHQPHAA